MRRAETIEEMTDAFLTCRDYGHHWSHVNDKITDTTRSGKIRAVTRYSECRSCTTLREESFDSSFDVTRHYTYPDGYLVIAGGIKGERLTVRDVRREVFARSGIHF
jgi:hypothetical protein